MRTPSVEASTSSAEVSAELAPDGAISVETPCWDVVAAFPCHTASTPFGNPLLRLAARRSHHEPAPLLKSLGVARHAETRDGDGAMRGQGHVTAGPSYRGAWLTWDTVDATYLARINPADLQDHTDERIRVEPRRGPHPGPWSSGSPDQNRPLRPCRIRPWSASGRSPPWRWRDHAGPAGSRASCR